MRSKTPLTAALVFWILAAAALLLDQPALAEHFGNWAYFALVVGVGSALLEPLPITNLFGWLQRRLRGVTLGLKVSLALQTLMLMISRTLATSLTNIADRTRSAKLRTVMLGLGVALAMTSHTLATWLAIIAAGTRSGRVRGAIVGLMVAIAWLALMAMGSYSLAGWLANMAVVALVLLGLHRTWTSANLKP